MSFQPVLPLTGLAGWQFLQRTAGQQQELYAQSPVIQRNTDAFRDRIESITTAEELVNDRQLLEVALGAFGLDDDIYAKAFVTQILESSIGDSEALANRLSDPRYTQLAQTFGFADIGGPFTWKENFAEGIIGRYEARQFQIAVGEQNNSMRLAMNAEQALTDIVDANDSDTARWFSIMGDTPLRTVFETAMGFSSQIGALDVDLQLEQFSQRAESLFGTSDPGDILTEDNMDKLIRLYLVRTEAASISGTSGAQIALTLLQNIA